MYANVCDSHRNIHPWPPRSQCPDVAIRQCSEKAHAALGRGGGCREVGSGGDVGEGGSIAAYPGWYPACTFLLGSVPSVWEEERPWAPLCSSVSASSLWFLQEPICFLSHPSSISGASHWRCTPPSLPSSRCLLAWSFQSCVQVRDGGRVTAEQGDPHELKSEPEPGGLGWGRVQWVQGGASVTFRLKNTHSSHLWMPCTPKASSFASSPGAHPTSVSPMAPTSGAALEVLPMLLQGLDSGFLSACKRGCFSF